MANWHHAEGRGATALQSWHFIGRHHGYARVMSALMSTASMNVVHPHKVLAPIGRSTSPLRGLPLHKPRSRFTFSTSYFQKHRKVI